MEGHQSSLIIGVTAHWNNPEWNITVYIPRFNEFKREVYWFHLVCSSVDRIVSTLYLQHNSSDQFHVCTSYQATLEGVSRVKFVSKFTNFGKFFKFGIFDFVFFWLGIQYDSIVWVIMRLRGVSSEHRRSSCYSFCLVLFYISAYVYQSNPRSLLIKVLLVSQYISIGEFKLELQSGNAQSGSNSTIFRAVWPWNLTDDLQKQ